MMKFARARLGLPLLLAIALPTVSPSASAETGDATLPQAAGVYRFMIGDVRIIALSDGTAPQDYHTLLRGITPAATDTALAREFEVNPVQTSVNVFLLEMAGRRVLIDTGTGDLFGPHTAGKLVSALKAAGVSPDQIDDILITHVHPDHVGGLVVGGEVVFSKAVVHFGQADLAFFVDPPRAGEPHADAKTSAELVAMIKPYRDAGRIATFAAETTILPGLTATPYPGHTPGSAFYSLESRGQTIVFVGDIVHSGAVQFADPGVTIMYDALPDKARAVRQAAFARFARDRTLIAAPHLSFPGVGHVRAAGQAYHWVPIEYADWPSR